MSAFHGLYLRACRRWAPDGLTLSAAAWKRFALTGNSFWRDRIDGFFLLFAGQRGHCQAQYQRESRAVTGKPT